MTMVINKSWSNPESIPGHPLAFTSTLVIMSSREARFSICFVSYFIFPYNTCLIISFLLFPIYLASFQDAITSLSISLTPLLVNEPPYDLLDTQVHKVFIARQLQFYLYTFTTNFVWLIMIRLFDIHFLLLGMARNCWEYPKWPQWLQGPKHFPMVH